MKLRKLEWWELPSRKAAQPVREVRTERVIERPLNIDSLLEPIIKDVDKLKKKRPEYVGGSGSVGSYHRVTTSTMTFRKTSFNPGINIIGVQSGVPTTIYLPGDLEPNHLISIKDELGVASSSPITVRVAT